MTITFNLTERAAANLLADAQAQGRPQAALIAEALEEKYGARGSATAAMIAAQEDDPYAAAMRHKLTDGFGSGRTYELESNMNAEAMAALEQEYGVAAVTGAVLPPIVDVATEAAQAAVATAP